VSFTTELMDAVKAAQAIGSDYRLAQVLGVTRATVSNWRTGRKFPTQTTVYELARLAGMDAGEALLGVMMDSRGPDLGANLRAAWVEAEPASG